MGTIFNKDMPGQGLLIPSMLETMLEIADRLRALGVSHPALLPQVSPHDIPTRLTG
jgi:hypothetical protein